MKNYKESITYLSKMFELYEKTYGFESEKSAKIFMELGQIYEFSEDFNDAIENYKNSYSIWEKIITNEDYEVLFTLAIKLSELYGKLDNAQSAYEILKTVKLIIIFKV
jgi:tetratricopeptide (TPR) repeat protein